MNTNLPQKIKKGIIQKMKAWLIKITTSKNNDITEEHSVENNDVKMQVREDFLSVISKQTNLLAETLQEKLKSGEVRARNLSDEEYEQVIDLYNTQITEMSNRLEQYKEKLAKLRKV